MVFLSINLTVCKTPVKGKKLQVTGTMRLVGSEPFTRLVISTKENKNYYIPRIYKKKYRHFINFIVNAHGIVQTKILYSADHKYKIIEQRKILSENCLENIIK